MIGELRRRGLEVDNEPDQEDFGWYLRSRLSGTEYHFLVGWRPDAGWLGWIERRVGFPAFLLGRQKREDAATPEP